jgi:hypothetical protein
MTVRFIVGDTRDVVAGIPDGSVDLLLTSPPFLALRSYLPLDHPQKHKEIGSEATPADFLDTLLALTDEWGRVLAPHGSICVELGDTYAGSGGAGGDWSDSPATTLARVKGGGDGGPPRRTAAMLQDGWPLDKSLTCIPQLYEASLAYGRNLLRPEHTFEPWRVRNLVAWCRANPPVGALGDKVRPATSYLIWATRARDRWFDLDSVRSNTTGPASRAVVSVADARVVPTTLLADGGLAAHGWCEPGSSKVAVGPSMTWQAQRLQVVDPVGFLVAVETVEGPKVMDLEAAGRPADAALVPVAVECLLSGRWPVAASVGGAPTLPVGVVLASEMDASPGASTLETAEVVRQDLALVAGHWLAARITLKINGSNSTAYAIAPVRSATLHSKQSNSNHGAPPLDWWLINPTGFSGSHYAVFPPELCRIPIEASCPRRVCRTCGKPSRRETKNQRTLDGEPCEDLGPISTTERAGADADGVGHWRKGTERETTGWSSCGCPGTDGIRLDGYHTGTGWRPGLVLDPFGGSGTVGVVANGRGRDCILVDLDERNADLARQRIGMFVDVEHHTPTEVVA